MRGCPRLACALLSIRAFNCPIALLHLQRSSAASSVERALCGLLSLHGFSLELRLDQLFLVIALRRPQRSCELFVVREPFTMNRPGSSFSCNALGGPFHVCHQGGMLWTSQDLLRSCFWARVFEVIARILGKEGFRAPMASLVQIVSSFATETFLHGNSHASLPCRLKQGRRSIRH